MSGISGIEGLSRADLSPLRGSLMRVAAFQGLAPLATNGRPFGTLAITHRPASSIVSMDPAVLKDCR